MNNNIDPDAKFQTLHPELQRALVSPELAARVRKIGEKHDLKLDQISVMFERTADILLGILPSRDFVSVFSREAEIDERAAASIATDLNAEIFDSLRAIMRAQGHPDADDAAAAEDSAAGVNATNAALAHKERTVSAIESAGDMKIVEPFAIHELGDTPAPKTQIPQRPSESLTEPLLDQLLMGAVASTEETAEIKAPLEAATGSTGTAPAETVPTSAAPANLPTAPDPYREQI